MRIVNPSFGHVLAATETLTNRPVDWLRDPIVLFSNSKPNARELLEGLKAKLGTVRNVDTVDFIYKESASRPADAAMIDAAARKYRGALLALGD